LIVVDEHPPIAEMLNGAADEAGRRDWDRPIRVRLHDGEGSGIDPYSVRLACGGVTYTVASPALTYDARAGVLTFDPRAVLPCPFLQADGEDVRVAVTASDYAGHPLDKPLEWRFVARSPLAVTPPSPDGERGWYVTAPRIEMRASQGARVRYTWAITPQADELFRRGNSINTLTVTVIGPDGKEQSFRKSFLLDTVVPRVTAQLVAGKDGASDVVVMAHNDYALESGGLARNLYASANWTDAPVYQDAKSPLGMADVPADVRVKARSAIWKGFFLPTEGGIHRLTVAGGPDEEVQLVLNGEKIVQATGTGTSEEVLLSPQVIPVELRVSGRGALVGQLRLDAQLGEGRPSTVPSDRLFVRRSLARVYYSWDGGKEQEYTEPITARKGTHVLSYWGVDEAGHRSAPERLTVGQAGR
jgi:hypothetical protein